LAIKNGIRLAAQSIENSVLDAIKDGIVEYGQ
jgi:hypothetical protein